MSEITERQREASPEPPERPEAAGGVATLEGSGLSREERLAAIVKQGSIQDLKSQPTDKVDTWPHLLIIEFVAMMFVLAFVVIFSIFVNAPFKRLANPNNTPLSSKAPWYFVGLQELLEYFTPQVSGVMIPGIAIVLMVCIPFIDKNPSNHPEDRKFAISLFTMFIMFWAVLTISGAIFRGDGFGWVLPWKQGVVFDL